MFLMEHFQEGGWGMWPILLLLGITVFISIDRFMYVSKSKVDIEKLMSLLKSQIVSGNIQGAINTCQASPAPVTKIIAAGLRRAGGTEHDVQQGMDEEALRELPKLEKRTGYLAMLGNLATLAGLLGSPLNLMRQRLLRSHYHDWHADNYSLGAYTYVPRGAIDASDELSTPVQATLFFAGEHTDTSGHWGTVHAALRSGYRAAEQLLHSPI